VEGMAHAVTGGTCRGINLMPDIEVCGKTGTAENPHGKDHSIFMGFAPRNNPKVSIFVIVENAGFGATFAVPIGRLMVQKYMRGEVPASDKYIEERIINTTILPQTFLNWSKYNKNNNEFSATVVSSIENDSQKNSSIQPFALSPKEEE
jgi:penicillin-binding protein 2